MKKFFTSTAFVLIFAIIVGSILGFAIKLLPEDAITIAREILMSIKTASGQIIFFMVPLLIIGCVTPSITRLSGNVSKLLVFTIVLAYLSSIFAAMFSLGVSHFVVPMLDFGSQQTVIELPKTIGQPDFSHDGYNVCFVARHCHRTWHCVD